MMRRLIAELLRFGGVGVLATAIHALLYTVALHFTLPQVANLIGYLTALAFSYVGHGRFSFADANIALRHPETLKRFLATSLFGFALNSGFVALSTHVIGKPGVAVWFIVGITPAMTYVLLKFWVYRGRGRSRS